MLVAISIQKIGLSIEQGNDLQKKRKWPANPISNNFYLSYQNPNTSTAMPPKSREISLKITVHSD
jgi:hypothetical protein